METATARIVVQVTPRQKQRILKQARAAGLNTSEFMRLAAEGFEVHEPETEELLDRIKQVAQECITMMDDCIAFVNEPNKLEEQRQ